MTELNLEHTANSTPPPTNFTSPAKIKRRSEYEPANQKIISLEKTLTLLDSLRFFMQITWEIKQIQNNQFIIIGKEIEDIGKMIGGWRKSLLTKTPTNKAGERK